MNKSIRRIRERKVELNKDVLNAPAKSVFGPSGFANYDKALKTMTSFTFSNKNRPPSLGFRRAVASLSDLTSPSSLDDVGPYRVICAYRIVREGARIKGVVSPGVPLCDCFIPSSDFPNPMMARTGMYPLASLDEQYRSRMLEIRDVVTSFAGCNALGNGLSFFPPDPGSVPDDWQSGNAEGDDSDQKCANRTYEDYVAAWFLSHELLAAHLGMFEGSEEHPRLGELGMSGLFDPAISHLIWPNDSSIFAFEGNLLAEIIQSYQQVGDIGTRSHLDKKYGMARHEIDELLNLAFIQNKASQLSDFDAVLSRESLRMEGIISRARVMGHIEHELSAARQLHKIIGLDARSKEEAGAEDYVDEMIATLREKKMKEAEAVENES